MNSLKRYADPVYCLMRLVVGLLFACHGGQKILGFPPPAKPPGDTLGWVGGYIELIGGFMIAFGLLTCIAAFIASGMMAVAYFMVHFPGHTIEKMMQQMKQPPRPITWQEHFFPLLNAGEAAVLYCFVFLFIVFYGSGRFSLDALIFKRGDTTVPATP
jgi:putative oxidoreductase